MKMKKVAACAAACAVLFALGLANAASDPRSLPMQFELWSEGPPQACGNNCRTWVSATGAITADTPRVFNAFAAGRNLEGVTLALDSDGGSVLGALEMGRTIRRIGMTTTVGKTVALAGSERGRRYGRLVTRAFCESMCAFVLLAGVERHVPAEARVLVHQIWLGDRRDDPTAANYSAEDLVLVQRDIGRLARYTVEMGGAIDLLEIALRIPPWEPMRLLTREQLRGMKIVTGGDEREIVPATAASSTQALASGARAVSNGRNWAVFGVASRMAITRGHPLTVDGDEIGDFELRFTCGDGAGDFGVAYVEERGPGDRGRAPEPLTKVEIVMAGRSFPLRIASSQAGGRSHEVHTYAAGVLPTASFKTFADAGARSLTVKTASGETRTAIRVGNAGMALSLPQLLSSCAGQSPARNTARTALNPGG